MKTIEGERYCNAFILNKYSRDTLARAGGRERDKGKDMFFFVQCKTRGSVIATNPHTLLTSVAGRLRPQINSRNNLSEDLLGCFTSASVLSFIRSLKVASVWAGDTTSATFGNLKHARLFSHNEHVKFFLKMHSLTN